jgi:rod shape-determining protein MreC
VQPSGQRALLIGDNSAAPYVDFIEAPDRVRPGDRILTSGDGGVFPAGLLVGQLAQDPGGRMRARLAADYERLEFLRVLRSYGTETIGDPGRLIAPVRLPEEPVGTDPASAPEGAPTPAEAGSNG